MTGLLLLCPTAQDLKTVLLRQAECVEREIAQAPGVLGIVQRAAVRGLGSPTSMQRKVLGAVGPHTLIGMHRLLKKPLDPRVLSLVSSWLDKTGAHD